MDRAASSSRGAVQLEAVIVAAVFLFSASIGYELLSGRRLDTLSEYLPPAVMLACGHGLVDPVPASPALRAFMIRERSSVSCTEAAGDGRTQPPNLNITSTRYAAWSIALALRAGGISWTTIDSYLAVMFALSMSLAYALFRLAVGRALAAAGVVALLFSNHTLAIALEFRDFSKEFWFIGAWLAIGWLLRRGRPSASPAIYVPACAAGAWLGLGLGFRADLFIIVPAVIAVIIFAIRGFNRTAFTVKAIGGGMFVVTFALVGAPILATYSKASSVSHVVVLGLMSPFTDALGIEAPPYDLGELYADGFAAAAIYAHARLVDHDHSLGHLGTPAYDRQGISLLKDVWLRFPADVIVRALGATRQVIANPFDPDAGREAAAIDPLTRTSARRRVLRWRTEADGWLHGHELLLIAAAFLAIAVRDRRLAVIATALVLYFAGYSMLQFGRRHTFQLDIIPTAMVLVALGGGASLAVSVMRRRVSAAAIRTLLLAVTTGTAMAATGIAGLAIVRAWQQTHVTALFERTLAAPSVDLSMIRGPVPRSVAHDGRLDTWEALAASRPVLSTAVLLQPTPGTWPAADAEVLFHAEYLVIELGGSQCAAGIVPVVVKYSSVYRTTDSDYTRLFNVAMTSDSQLLVPIFELPGTSHFDGLAVPGERAACVRRVRRVSPPDGVPQPNLFAVLHANWRSTPLYQRLRDTTAAPGSLPLARYVG